MWWRVLVCIMLFGAGTTHAAEVSSAEAFWKQFRCAILAGETEKVASMTKFPLWVRGPDDSDPVNYYTRDKFPIILKRLLNQEIQSLTNGTVQSKTMRQAIGARRTLASEDFLPGGVVAVEQFEFEQVHGRWTFVRAFLEE